MIIVNQNKNKIINFDNVERIDITVSKDSLCYNVNFETAITRDLLGNYATEERAKEILQEIVNEYKKYLVVMGGTGVSNIPKAYIMPKK